MTPRRRSLGLWVPLLALAWACVAPQRAHAEPWHYTIDQVRSNQQANFCLEEAEVMLIAEVFRRFGARPGYAALSQSPQCLTRVASFTPKAIVTRVTISKGKPGEYIVSFVEVLTSEGKVEYLVTTREVRE